MTASSAPSRKSRPSADRSAIAERVATEVATRSLRRSHGMGWDRSDEKTPPRDAYARSPERGVRMTPDQTKRAKAVIDRLVEAEPRPANHGPGWIIAVERRIKTERWPDVCALVAEHPDLAVDELVAIASPSPASPPEGGVIHPEPPNPSSAITEWTGPDHDPADGPVVDQPADVRARLDAARAALHATRKPDMGPPPVPTRGGHR